MSDRVVVENNSLSLGLIGALAGASAPELARLVKETTESNTAVNAVAHAVLGGVVAALQGN